MKNLIGKWSDLKTEMVGDIILILISRIIFKKLWSDDLDAISALSASPFLYIFYISLFDLIYKILFKIK